MNSDYIKANKAAWEEAFEKHQQGWGADMAAKLREADFYYLKPEVLEEFKLLNLKTMSVGQFCCNNGRELLSILKLGAQSGVGFDLAENFIAEAQRLAQQTGLNGQFLATNIYDIPDRYYGAFDLLLITIGALCWFQDLDRFFQQAAAVLKTSGILIINEVHPITGMLAAPGETNYVPENPGKLANSYFRREPWVENQGMDYVGGTSYPSKTFYSFSHTYGEITSALAGNGIRLKKLREFDHDISGNFHALDSQGIPLSYLLIGEK